LSSIGGLKKVHDRLSRVIIEKMDGVELIQKYDKKNVFIYADPPYHQSTRTGARYTVDMGNDKQKEFIDSLLLIKNSMILVSGYECEEYDRLSQAGWSKELINVNTTDGHGSAKSKTEILWKNYGDCGSKEDLFPDSIAEETEGTTEESAEVVSTLQENLFGEVSVEKKTIRGEQGIPYKLTCVRCQKDKKTNTQAFRRCLERANVSKGLFIETYICRSCRSSV
jgi:hypothetical protein